MDFRFFYLIITILLVGEDLHSQNIVPNSSFESCTPQCSLNGNNNIFDIEYWQRPNRNTSDLYSTLLQSNCQMHMPGTANFYDGYIGEQMPRTGNVLGGFINEGRLWFPGDTIYGSPNPYREYFSVPLVRTLEIGKTYCTSLYVSLPGNNDHCSNNIGVYFSDQVIFQNDYKAIYATPQVIEKKVIRDTLNWILISGCFMADKAYNYLTIGNFSKMDSTLFLNRSGRYKSMDYFFSYYFIDDISVEEFTPHALVATQDTSICRGSSIQLEALGPDHIWWSTASRPNDTLSEGSILLVMPDSSITYIVHGSDCKCVSETKEIKISVYPSSQLYLGTDTTICELGTITFDLPSGFHNCLWSNNSIGNSLVAHGVGEYWVLAQDQYNCFYSDTINVKKAIRLPNIALGPDVVFCDPFKLEVKEGYEYYTWPNGVSSSNFYNVTKPGEYFVSVVNECGFSSDSMKVISIDDIKITCWRQYLLVPF